MVVITIKTIALAAASWGKLVALGTRPRMQAAATATVAVVAFSVCVS